MKVVVVESPAKAKTINKYLGSDYHVLASFGHVRDLPPKDGSVRPEADFEMSWDVEGRGAQKLREIAAAVKKADRLILATDPDREGEAISWHIVEALQEKKALGKVPVERVAFNEITKRAVTEAIAKPRQIDQELVDAYLARRALDYLVGFTLSPVLWRKLPGSRSAGRVQSVALRLICEREAEIEAFKPREYWTIEAVFETREGQTFTARLTHLDGRKLDKFDLKDEATAKAATQTVKNGIPFRVSSVERKTVKRNPFPPFTTSTLQQEASRKLGFGASHTMRVAQRLYEGVDIGGETVGIITYMRTDGVTLSQDAIDASRKLISEQYGMNYLPQQPRVYRTAAKNAQEAHEAIRPTDLFRKPDRLRQYLSQDEYRLYDLIWKRTLASQMESAELDQVAIDLEAADKRSVLRATGSVVKFDGFLTLYQEDRDDPLEDDDSGRRLPNLQQGDGVKATDVTPEQHFTQPPPRYSEASLIKRLEELGIGRPSTYTSILQTLEDRAYVKLEKKRLIPEDRGRIVTVFLTNFFERYVQYGFTADLEEKLDDISGGRADWKQVLRDFWRDFAHLHQPDEEGNGKLPSMSEAVAFLDKGIGTRSVVIDALNEALAPHFFPDLGNGKNPRACPACSNGELGIKLAKNGAFIGCSNYPECRYTRPLAVANGEETELAGPQVLGADPKGGEVSLRKGPYGFYVQLDSEGEAKPKRVSLLKNMTPENIDLDTALQLLALPRDIGKHPETGETILAGIGRFGPYLKHGSAFKSIPKDDDVLTIGINRAVALLAEPSGRGRGRAAAAPGREIGKHPDDDAPITVHDGRYGPYVKHGSINATVPKGTDPASLSLQDAIALIAARAEKVGSGKPGRKTAAKKPAAKKAANKKTAGTETAVKKPAAKKAAAKKPAAKKPAAKKAAAKN
ncbi:type I DNA topoisomerase [Dongia soli]|uniref:DNA topoisomerase 1 n=1 Tax=Dongia soli TaxID=600628 RepID=A0ABU5EKH2_9PROT|nr:type I DNA topoisomerase [Dongia soli]MDY0885606.1 type I DNA topoisomerase [Dongia soli]